MLQRAASNAYSWWWASHIRTKQSRWLDSSVHEMEEKVKTMIKLIDEDADTFAKKAEMYFKRRPELINFVEETYKAYRALADRYDRISGELHKANHTIATVFPDHVQLMEDDEDDGTPKAISSIDSSKFPNPPPVSTNLPKPPAEIPPLSARIKSREAQSAPKKLHHKSVTSQISREKAQEEIDRLQKEILVLQTKKEFFKSSYESGLAKYWDSERQMTELQEEVSQLQDEFSAGGVIEDNEARALMAATALKSCEDTLVSLQEQQKISTEEARIESERIKIAKKMLQALKGEWEIEEISNTNTTAEEVGSLKHERLELQSICQKVKEHFEMSSDASVVELAEKIDELVDKVISLEAIVSSQTAQIQRLRSETDELQKHLRGLEEDKQNLIGDSNDLNQRLIQAEEELSKVQELEKSVKNEKGILQTHFAEACDSLNDLSEKLQSPKGPSQEEMLFSNPEPAEEIHARNVENNPEKVKSGHKDGDIDQMAKAKSQDEEEDIPDWQQLLLKGIEGKGRMILLEYSSMLQSFKETKKRLTEMEKKNQEDHMETMSQIQELRNVNAVKDDEIRKLRQKLFSHNSLDGRRGTKEGAKNLQRLADLIVNKTDPPLQVADIGSLLIEEQVKLCHLDQPHTASPMVDKFRADIDTLLEENLDFWLRFSTSYHQIQKFQETFKELQSEVEKEMELKNQEGGSGETNSSPTDKKLRDFNTELQVWLEKNALLKGELQCRFTSICSIQEEISKVSKASETENVQFTPYQAAKFQGEVLNMRQENKKVAKELQTGLDHVRGLQVEVGRALSRLRQNFELSKGNHHNYHHNMRHLSTKTRIPLRTFLFGAKPKKPSIFSCMNPAFHKQYSDMRAAGGRYPA